MKKSVSFFFRNPPPGSTSFKRGDELQSITDVWATFEILAPIATWVHPENQYILFPWFVFFPACRLPWRADILVQARRYLSTRRIRGIYWSLNVKIPCFLTCVPSRFEGVNFPGIAPTRYKFSRNLVYTAARAGYLRNNQRKSKGARPRKHPDALTRPRGPRPAASWLRRRLHLMLLLCFDCWPAEPRLLGVLPLATKSERIDHEGEADEAFSESARGTSLLMRNSKRRKRMHKSD